MNRTPFLIFVIASLCFGASDYILISELRTNYTDGSPSNTFLTGYSYDATGQRLQKRVWSGVDSTAAAMSVVRYGYTANGAIAEEVLVSGSDTLSIVRYDYADSRLVKVRTLTKSGTLRFLDTLLYDAQGRLIEEQRINSAGTKTYYHRYTYDASGRKVADTLYELRTSTYNASQAFLFSYNVDSTVSTEAHWQLSVSSWYCISTAFMGYSARKLVSVATRERDGVGTKCTDSLAYSYDGSGNRVKEEEYDGAKTILHKIDYTWRLLHPTMAMSAIGSRGADRHFAMIHSAGRLTAKISDGQRGELALFDLAGKCIRRSSVENGGSIVVSELLGKGSYVAVFTGKNTRQIETFSN